MSSYKAKESVNLRMILMQKIRPLLEKRLGDNHIISEVENITDDTLGMKIQKGGYKTHLLLYRLRHKPLQVEIEADHRMNSKTLRDPANRDRRQSGNRGGFYRYYFYFILISIIASILVYFSLSFLDFYTSVTPGWSTMQRALAMIAFANLIIISRVYLWPRIQQRRLSRIHGFQKDLVSIVASSLNEIEKEFYESDKVKCWSCFEEIDRMDDTCQFCDSVQH
ncbi:MAG: hypothetical protein ACXAB7_09465 [Candidatus Kariarchaeaceae archaeon]